MEFLINFFNVFLYQPLFNLLILFYLYLPGNDFGIAIIVLTVLVRVIFYPLNLKAIKSQKVLQELQPKIQEIQKKHKGDKEKLTKATIELYQKGKINPLSGCLPVLAQFPILIALFWVFQKGLQAEQINNLYSFVPNPGLVDPSFLGLINLSQSISVKIGDTTQFLWLNIVLVALAGILQFIQTKMMSPRQLSSQTKKGAADFSTIMQKQMLYIFPVFTVFILSRLPSAIALYWLVTSLFSIFQQYLIFKPRAKNSFGAEKES